MALPAFVHFQIMMLAKKFLHYGAKEEAKKKGNESPQFVITDIAVYLETCEINLV
jgi:hypothetical protein